MKSGVPWNIKGIDDETREAARLAARQSGLSVSEWLNEVIAERAAALGVPSQKRDESEGDDGDRDVAEAVDRLARRVRAMDETSRSALSGLKGRLDEIERNLAALPRLRRGTSERGRILTDVAALVADLSRDIDNVDENARQMIEGLRDRNRRVGGKPRAGSVADAIRDLDRRISSIGQRTGNPPPSDGADRLDEVRDHLDALLAKGPQPPAPRPERAASLDASLRSLETKIDSAKARLARVSAPPSPAEDDRMRRIEAQLADIAGLIGTNDREPVEESPPTMAAPPMHAVPVDDLAAAIAEISARQQMLDERSDARAEMINSVASLHNEIAGLADKMAAFGRVGAEDKGAFYDLIRRIDALAAEKPLDRNLLSSMRENLESLRSVVEGESGRTADIVDRLDTLLDRAPDRGRLDALGEEVSALRRALEATDSPRAIARLEMRFAELARSVESAVNGDGKARRQAESESLARLEATLNEVAVRIDGLLDRTSPTDAIVAVHDRIADLAARLDHIDAFQRGPAAGLDEIKAELAALRHELAGRAPPRTDHLEARIAELVARLEAPPRADRLEARIAELASRLEASPRTDHLETRIAELASRLDSVTGDQSDGDDLADLEAQVAYLSAELERVIPRTVALERVEENLARLQGLLSENRQESVEAARRAARETVSELAADRADGEILAALKKDLETIRGATGTSDLQTRQTLGAVHDTLARVVERLSRLEAGETAARTRSEAEATVPRAEVEAAWAVADPAAGDEDHRPLEPGSGKPDIAALRELTRSASDAPRDKRSDRKADFIAAARRAAQAAAAEAKGTVPMEDELNEPKQSAFARIGQAIRSRRRPLLLAAAAIVLAIGALQIFGDRLTTPVETAAGEKPPPSVVEHPVALTGLEAEEARSAIAMPTPKPSEPALVAPASSARAALAFTEPEAFDSRFGDMPETPPAEGFSAGATDAPSASRGGTQTASLDGAVPQPKQVAPMPDAGIGSPRLLNAAAAGDAAAAFEVAVRYAEGRGVPSDLAKAGQWYARAAEGGIAVAQYRLGSLYERGQGVAKDTAAAVTWYQRAADQGNVGAMHNLAVLMSEGVDGTPDHAKALQWFQTAAYYGVKDSQYNLGVIYARGIGVDADMIEAYKWFAVAAAQGDSDAATRRDDIAKLMKPDDLAKARAAVSSWHAKPALPDANAVIAPEGGWDEPAGRISEGDRRQLVMKIQALLAEQGYDPGPADGVPGERTVQAVRAFQKTIGAAETGEINRDLVTALAGQT